MGHYESSAKRIVRSIKCPHKECEESSRIIENSRTKRNRLMQEGRRQEIIKKRAEINKIETKKTKQRINETKSCFFEKINNTDKSLSKLIKRQK